jgi:hypothetical protein
MIYTERPGADEYAPFYGRYVTLVPAGDLVRVLDRQVVRTITLLDGVPREWERHAYAPGKWTVREVVGHLADVERVMAHRVLRIARGDPTELPGFDEDGYVAAAGFDRRGLADLAAELRSVRLATVSLLTGLPPEAWTRRGRANGEPVSVRALACIIAGHELHHRAILEERYGLSRRQG